MPDLRTTMQTAQTRLQPAYYDFKPTRRGKARIDRPPCIPVGMTFPIFSAWGRGLRQGLAIDPIAADQVLDTSGRGHQVPDTSGRGHIVNGRFTLDGAPRKPIFAREPMVGRGFFYDASGHESSSCDFLLPDLRTKMVLDRQERLGATIEAVPHPSLPGKLEVVERVMANQGLPEDASKVGYLLTAEGAQLIQEKIIDTDWITETRIIKDPGRPGQYKCLITYQYEAQSGTQVKDRHLELEGRHFIDNEGNALLQNPKQHLGSLTDIYQADFYTQETERWQPVVDQYGYNGPLRLVLNRVKRYAIDQPADLVVPPGYSVKLFPAAADAAVKVNNNWIPVTLKEPLRDLRAIDSQFCEIVEGFIQHVIGPQIKMGEGDNYSGDYPRDIYFYGAAIQATLEILMNWGENFGINRGKAIRALGAIHSGRTHLMDWKMLFNKFADLVETNNPFFVKLCNFAEELNSPGVSEDAQMEIQYRLRGIRMWVSKQMIALMKAEKNHAEFNTQNTNRYIYSEALFVLSTNLAMIDIIQGRFLGWLSGHNVLFSWADMAEKLAGRTWYKWAFNKETENASIPVYLGLLGYIVWYPVDLLLFSAAWALRTVASGINYVQHLHSLGMKSILTGFFNNPVYELTFLKGYTRGAMAQIVYRNQYGNFARTVEAASTDAVPKNYVKAIKIYSGAMAAALTLTIGLAIVGGLAGWLLFPLGMINAILGLSRVARSFTLINQTKLDKTKAFALLTLGAAMAIIGAPVIWHSFLSIAVMANFGFGFYSFFMLRGARAEMKKALEHAEHPVAQVFVDGNEIWRGVRLEIDAKDKEALRNKIKDFITRHSDKYKYDHLHSYLMVNGAITAEEETELRTQEIIGKGQVGANDGLTSFVQQTRQSIPLQGLADTAQVIEANQQFETIQKSLKVSPFSASISRADLLAAVPKINIAAEHGNLRQLEDAKRNLKSILVDLHVMDNENRTHQGFTHPYRILTMEMLDTYSNLEMSICTITRQLLAVDRNDKAAKDAFMRLMSETRNYTAVNIGRLMVRQFDLCFGPTLMERARAIFKRGRN